MQLYLVSPLVLFLLWKYRIWGLLVLGVGALASMGCAFYEVWEHSLPGIAFGSYRYDEFCDFRSTLFFSVSVAETIKSTTIS